MKEEIYHLYKRRVEPLLKRWTRLLSHTIKSIPLFSKLAYKPPIKNFIFRFEYLFIDKEDNVNSYLYYLEKGLRPLIIKLNDVDALDKNLFYLVLGQYDEVVDSLNYLRERNVKALWDQTWMELDSHKPFWKRRVAVVEAIYSDLMTESLENRSILLDEKSEWIDFENKIFNVYSKNKEVYKHLINEHLKTGWEWQRVNPMTISIMLEAIAEYHAFNTPRLVLITQSVKTAKNYCGETDYKIINAILDNYFRKEV